MKITAAGFSCRAERTEWLPVALSSAGANRRVLAAILGEVTALRQGNAAREPVQPLTARTPRAPGRNGGGGIEWHVARIGVLAHRLALAAGCGQNFADAMLVAAPLHDIGKLVVPDAILQKQGRLTDEETQAVQRHTEVGAHILRGKGLPLLDLASEIALTHHENWAGSGYPCGLAGKQIPLSGRITAVADVFDALLSGRPYKEPWPLEEVRAFLAGQAGKQFDPRLAGIFLADLDRMAAVRITTPRLVAGPAFPSRPAFGGIGARLVPAWGRLCAVPLSRMPEIETLPMGCMNDEA